jgi:phage N-6-adenine-methyltransferase
MSNDLWRTPPQLFNAINKEFEFVADMAASKENALCSTFFTEDDDSLSFDWAQIIRESISSSNAYAWLNCPYSNPLPWVHKAIESQKNGLGVVMLLNADCSVGWFHEALKGASEIRFIVSDGIEKGKAKHSSGRIGFLGGNGNPQNGNNKPQFILVFNPFKIGANVTTYIKKSELIGE